MTQKTLKLTCMPSPSEDPHFGPTTCIHPLKEPTFKSWNVQISKRWVTIHTSSGVGCHTHLQRWVPHLGPTMHSAYGSHILMYELVLPTHGLSYTSSTVSSIICVLPCTVHMGPTYTCMNWSYPHKSHDRKTPHWFLHINQITSISLIFYLLILGNFLCSFWFFFSL